jgi:hypothetical protein
LSHAASWNKPIAELDADIYAQAIDRWLTYDEQHGIEQISFGALVLRGQPGAASIVGTDPLRAGSGSASDQIQRVFAAYDDLRRSKHPILERRFRLVEGHRLDQSLALDSGHWNAGPTTLTLLEGIGFELTLDAVMTQVLIRLDGSNTAAQATVQAGAVGELGDSDLAALRELSAQMVCELYRIGLLEPA